jgi:hypothetical protein
MLAAGQRAGAAGASAEGLHRLFRVGSGKEMLMPKLNGVLETVLYVEDLERADAFYRGEFYAKIA